MYNEKLFIWLLSYMYQWRCQDKKKGGGGTNQNVFPPSTLTSQKKKSVSWGSHFYTLFVNLFFIYFPCVSSHCLCRSEFILYYFIILVQLKNLQIPGEWGVGGGGVSNHKCISFEKWGDTCLRRPSHSPFDKAYCTFENCNESRVGSRNRS
jgi:hypothetical protein